LHDRLSKLADIAFPTITKIESGDTPNLTIETTYKIAKTFGAGVDDLLKGQ